MREPGLHTSLTSFAPAARRWPIALQAAIAMAAPVAIGTALGFAQLGLLCGLGAFTALYCTQLSRRDRVRVLPLVALGLIVSAAFGVAVASSPILTSIGLVVLGAAAVWGTLGIKLGPPGAMMFVLVYGASAHLAAPVTRSGAGLDGVLLICLIAAGSAFSYLVVISPLIIKTKRWQSGPPTPLGTLFPRFVLTETATVVAWRTTVAIVASAAVSSVFGSGHGYWIACSAIAILSAGHSKNLTVNRSVHRVLGTVVGAGIFLLLVWAEPHGYLLAVALAALQFIVELIVVRHYALALAFITPLALVITTSSLQGDVTGVVGERVLDTVIGAVFAVLVLWISRPRLSPGGTTAS